MRPILLACVIFLAIGAHSAETKNGYLEVGGWPAPKPPLTGWNLYMSDKSGVGYKKVNPSPITSTTQAIGGLDIGKAYYFVLTALSQDSVESKPSQEFSKIAGATPSPQAALAPAATAAEMPVVTKPKRRMWGNPESSSAGAAQVPAKTEDLVHWLPEGEALALSKQTGKPLLYDFMAAWCGPCKRLAKDVFGNPEQAKWINQEFLAVRIQDLKAEQGRNPMRIQDLQDKYKIKGFPTLIVDLPGHGFGPKWKQAIGYGDSATTRKYLEDSLAQLKITK